MPVGFPAKTTYANGDVFSASDINDTNGTLNLVNPATTPTVQANPVLNSAFQVWQRGTSVALAASTSYISGFTSDRWQTGTGANQAITVSRQLVSDSTNLPFIQYCSRYQRNSGQTGTGTLTLAQSFESLNSVPFAGRTVTFSFYARAGANYSAASSALLYQVYTGTGTDQNIFSGSYTGAVAAINTSATLTTTWQRFTATATLATNTNELAVQFLYVPVGTAGANDWYEITGVQINVGSSALPFRTYAGTIQGELAACQRYYWQTGLRAFRTFAVGQFFDSTNGAAFIALPVTMRVNPSVSASAATDFEVLAPNGTGISLTATSFGEYSTDAFTMNLTTAGSMSAGQASVVRSKTAGAASLKVSAEL